MRGREARGNFLGRDFQHFADEPRNHVRIGDLRWNRERGIHRHAHGQRIHVAVENFGAACADLHDQPLLVLRAGIIFAVAEELQVGKASQCRPGPKRRQGSHNQ